MAGVKARPLFLKMTIESEIFDLLSCNVYTTRRYLVKKLGYDENAIRRALERMKDKSLLDSIKVRVDANSRHFECAYLKVDIE